MWKIEFTNRTCRKLLYWYFWTCRSQSLTNAVVSTNFKAFQFEVSRPSPSLHCLLPVQHETQKLSIFSISQTPTTFLSIKFCSDGNFLLEKINSSVLLKYTYTRTRTRTRTHTHKHTHTHTQTHTHTHITHTQGERERSIKTSHCWSEQLKNKWVLASTKKQETGTTWKNVGGTITHFKNTPLSLTHIHTECSKHLGKAESTVLGY